MKGNWFSEEHTIPTILLAYCKNTEQNGKWCKEPDEVDKWLQEHPQYFPYQKTNVQKDIFEDNEKVVDDHPFYGD